MSDSFKEDKIRNEKDDPSENSSLRFIYIPIVLISGFLGFGVTYLAMRTQDVSMSPGDSRTIVNETVINVQNTGLSFEELATQGKKIYATNCQVCHQATGMGLPGTFPPLDGSEWVVKSKERLAAIVLHGLQGEVSVKGEKYNSVMPPFKETLSENDLAAVTTYIRSAWTNKADMIGPKLIKAVLEKTKARTGSWNGEAELKSVEWE